MGVRSAFLNGVLQNVYVDQPKGFKDSHYSDHVFHF